jgi:hypothetical protein
MPEIYTEVNGRPAPTRLVSAGEILALSLSVLLAACATITPTPVTSTSTLAGVWEGFTDNGRGGVRPLTITVAEDGTFQAVSVDGGSISGNLRLDHGRLVWSDVSGAHGPLHFYDTPARRTLRGWRADGTAPFEWNQRK